MFARRVTSKLSPSIHQATRGVRGTLVHVARHTTAHGQPTLVGSRSFASTSRSTVHTGALKQTQPSWGHKACLRTSGRQPSGLASLHGAYGRHTNGSPALMVHRFSTHAFVAQADEQEGAESLQGQWDNNSPGVNLMNLYTGISAEPFPKEVAAVLGDPVDPNDVEIKPDGLIYLPEIKYRRYLNRAFGPGGWGMVPIGEPQIHGKSLSREYALFCLGRFVAQARGEQDYSQSSFMSFASACESTKSNALMRCCKDLGIASELWDPSFITEFKDKHAITVLAENTRTKDKRKLWRLKTSKPFGYPWRELGGAGAPSASSSPVSGSGSSSTSGGGSSASASPSSSSSSSSATAPSSSASASSATFKKSDPVPPMFKKFQGMTWGQFLKEPQAKRYLEWVLSTDAQGSILSQAKQALKELDDTK